MQINPRFFAKKYLQSILVFIMAVVVHSSAFAQVIILKIDPVVSVKKSVNLPPNIRQNIPDPNFVEISNIEGILHDSPSSIEIQLGDILPSDAPSLPGINSIEAFNLLTQDAKLVAGTLTGDQNIDAQFSFFKGPVGNNGWINLSISQMGVMGFLHSDSKTYIIQPFSTDLPAEDGGNHVIYEMETNVGEQGWCGLTEDMVPSYIRDLMSGLHIQSNLKSASAQLTVELAVETDYETFESFDYDSLLTTAYLLSIIASVSEIYEREVDIHLEVVFSRVWTTPEDPYTELGWDLFPEFAEYWNNNMTHVERDGAILIIKDPSRLSGGLASVHGFCTEETGYAISGENIHIVAHELGHNFGALHTHDCGWPSGPDGTLAPIDLCSTPEGNCGITEIIREEGTIMSYCPSVKNEFHPLVQNFIRARAEASLCIGSGVEQTNTVSGKVSSGGIGLAGVNITANRYDGVQLSTLTEEDGSFSFVLDNATYHLIAEHDSFLIVPVDYTSSAIWVNIAGVDVKGVDFEAIYIFPDEFEPDNTVGEARQIPVGETVQFHSLPDYSDVDFVFFEAVPGQSYYIATTTYEPKIYPGITLFDTDGQTELASTYWPYYLEFVAQSEGPFYIRINNNRGFYGLTVSSTPFSEIETELVPLRNSQTDWGDYDDDGDPDLMHLGGLSDYTTMELYNNQGGSFIKAQAGMLPLSDASSINSIDWGDYENDGDLDALVSGIHATIYLNQRGVFDSVIMIQEGISYVNSASWGDYDNDGDQDILLQADLVEQSQSEFPEFQVLRNDSGTFTNLHLGLKGSLGGKLKWGDYDADGDLDILVTGASYTITNGTYSDHPFTRIYRNDGGSFIDANVVLEQLRVNPDIALGDFDNDGDPDIALAGSNGSSLVTKIYRNDHGIFNDIYSELAGVRRACLAWGDYDNDGDLDLAVSGSSAFGHLRYSVLAKIYINQNGSFEETPYNNQLPDILGLVDWVDYDTDDNLDLFLMGYDSYNRDYVHLLKNISPVNNNPPSPPTTLSAAPDKDSVSLTWTQAQDDKTPAEGLSYNLRIGTQPGGLDVLSPLADEVTGKRKIVAIGNAGQPTHHTIHNLLPGTYYWSVQAIDNSYAGSSWATEESFNIACNDNTYEETISICEGESYLGWTETGIYTRYLTSTTGCDSVISSNLQVNSKPLPPIIVQSGDTLISDAIFGNQWYLNNSEIEGAIDQKYIAVEEGAYYVILIDSKGCASYESNYIDLVFSSVGKTGDSQFNIYPNPVTSQLTIQTTITGQYTIEITSLNGQVLFNSKIEKPTHQIDLFSFQKGFYFITIKTSDFVRIEKIIKL